VAATICVAALSWHFIENPIRHGALSRLRADIKAGRPRAEPLSRRAWAGAAAVAAVLVAALAGLAGVGVGPDTSKTGPGNIRVSQTIVAERTNTDADSTSCDSVVHIGDSTSEGLVSEQYLPNPKRRISAQYARVGATTQHLEISGARSIYERFEGLANANDVALSWKQQHFDGCWVLALGTNEAANVAAGSKISLDKRIDIMMKTIGDEPVMWVNVKSLVPNGPYAAANMQLWNAALLRACTRYPNMRVYDWAAEVQDDWFIDDGIHFTSDGYAARGKLIARALLAAFPDGGSSPGGAECLVKPAPEPPAAEPPRGPATARNSATPETVSPKPS
jgi:hypothetical protein